MDEKTIHKVIRAEIRGVDEEHNTVTALVSGEKLDRYREVILASAWAKRLAGFKAHNVLVSSHRYSDLRAQIGEVPTVKSTGEGLESKLQYYAGEGNPEADWGWHLALKGKAAFSVGFIPHASLYKDDDGYDDVVTGLRERGALGKKDSPRRIYTDVELLEISHVLVPAYPDALQKAAEDEDPVMAAVAKEVSECDELECVMEAVRKGLEEIAEKAKYTCECIKCGHTVKTDKHCKDLKCPKCGGQMRRAEKPGPGQETYAGEANDPDDAEDKDTEEIGDADMKPYPNEHSCRLEDPGKFKDPWFRVKRKHDGKEYSVIRGTRKDTEKVEDQAFRYKKDVWKEAEAKKHCTDHDGAFEAAKEEALEFLRAADAEQIEGDFLDDGLVVKFHGSPRNPFGAHCSFRFKDGASGYKRAWTLHFSQINGGSTTAAASGPIRGTVRRIAMIAAAMKPPCKVAEADGMGPRGGAKSPLPGKYPETPADYGLKNWLKPSDEDVEPEKALRFTCSDLNTVKRIAVAEIKRRIKDREETEKEDISDEERQFFEWLNEWDVTSAIACEQCELLTEGNDMLKSLNKDMAQVKDLLAESLAKQAEANASRGEKDEGSYLKNILEKVDEINEGLRKKE